MPGALQRAWAGRGPLAWSLRPLSLAYGLLAGLHRTAYRAGLLRAARLPVPVIVVGNVVAGGAGKTPVVIALVEHLRARGIAAGVVARGYGRRSTECLEVLPGADPAATGDEPLLVRRRTGAPVFVARRRAEAAEALLRAHPGVRVLVSDDGLQHHALARDVEICVFDGRGIGNGWLLPAGPLREPWPRPVDLVLAHGDPPGLAALPLRRRLAAWAERADGTRLPLAQLAARRVHAIAGIARPEGFFAALRTAGVEPASTAGYPDHHPFDTAPAVPAGCELVCTEKDAAKVWRHVPGAWAVPLEVELPPQALAVIDRLVAARLSSTHGSATA